MCSFWELGDRLAGTTCRPPNVTPKTHAFKGQLTRQAETWGWDVQPLGLGGSSGRLCLQTPHMTPQQHALKGQLTLEHPQQSPHTLNQPLLRPIGILRKAADETLGTVETRPSEPRSDPIGLEQSASALAAAARPPQIGRAHV